MRIDKWLWAVRLYKTRTIATDACKGGKVQINDQAVKPSRDVHVGEVVKARANEINRTVRVVGLTENRVGPKLVPNFLEDLTPAEEYLRAMQVRTAPVAVREKGSGRPTKRERRQLDQITSSL